MPTISAMLIYSTAVGIFYIKSSQRFEACIRIEWCAPSFSLFPFIAEVSFWFIVLYVPIVFASKPQAAFEQIKRNWWIAAPMIAFSVWHISVGVGGAIRSLRYLGDFDLIACDIFFYPALGLLLPWLFWLLPKFFQLPGPALPTMLIYSVAAANASIRLWIEAVRHGVVRYVCRGAFSLPLFLAEVVMWFIALYVLMKLTLRMERQVTN